MAHRYFLSRCQHPHILPLLQYIDPAKGQGHAYLIHPYMRQGSLCERLGDKEKPMKWEFKVKILKEACSALVYLHEEVNQGAYVHGDINRFEMVQCVSSQSEYGM